LFNVYYKTRLIREWIESLIQLRFLNLKIPGDISETLSIVENIFIQHYIPTNQQNGISL